MLIRLKDGDFLDCWCFNGVRAMPDRKNPGGGLVIVDTINGHQVYLVYPTYSDAAAAATNLALEVNAARGLKPVSTSTERTKGPAL